MSYCVEFEPMLHEASKAFFRNVPKELTELGEDAEWKGAKLCDEFSDLHDINLDSSSKVELQENVNKLAEQCAHQLTISYEALRERGCTSKPSKYNFPVRVAGVRAKGAVFMRTEVVGTRILFQWGFRVEKALSQPISVQLNEV